LAAQLQPNPKLETLFQAPGVHWFAFAAGRPPRLGLRRLGVVVDDATCKPELAPDPGASERFEDPAKARRYISLANRAWTVCTDPAPEVDPRRGPGRSSLPSTAASPS